MKELKFGDTMASAAKFAEEVKAAESKAQKLAQEIGRLKNELPGVEAKVSELTTALESSKRERQRLTALGENTATVEKQVEKLQRELDAAGDKAAGMNALLIEKTEEMEKVAPYVKEKNDELATLQMFAIMDKYNEQAAILGGIVERLIKKRISMGMSRPYSFAECVAETGALQMIPRFVQGGIYRDETCSGHKENEELYFWSAEKFQYATERWLHPFGSKVPAGAQ